MSGEFLKFPQVEPKGNDQLLLIRGESERRTSVSDLYKGMENISTPGKNDGAIAYSKTPPTKGQLWGQIDDTNRLIELWQRLSSTEWISVQSWSCETYDWMLKRNRYWVKPNPLNGDFFIESLTAKGIIRDTMRTGDYVDCFIKFVDSRQRRVPIHYVRIENKSKNETFEITEDVGIRASLNEAIGLWLSAERKGQTKIGMLSIAARLRRYYAVD